MHQFSPFWHMPLPHRLQGQKVKSQSHGAGAYCGGDLAAQLVIIWNNLDEETIPDRYTVSKETIVKKLITRWNMQTLLANTNYRSNHVIVVKLYQPYTKFSYNVRLSHRDIFGASWLFWLLRRKIFLFTNLLMRLLLILICGSSME